MERVDHVDVIEIGRCCFICQVDRMLQRQIPDRECFKFSVAGLNAAFMFMIEAERGRLPFYLNRDQEL